MKNILVILFLIIGFNTVAQPPGYTKRNIRENVISFIVDSTFHVPRYNGTPSGVRSGGYVADGAIAIDTTNHRGYIYSGGAWVRMANFSELSSYVAVADSAAMLANYLRGTTEGFGIDISGSQHKTWAADSTSGGVLSWVRGKKIADSLGALITAANTIYTGDGTLSGNRTVTMNGKTLSFNNSGESKMLIDPVSDNYSFGDGDGAAANLSISSTRLGLNFGGVDFHKFTYTGRQTLIGDVGDNWDGIKVQMDNSGVTKYGSLTFGDTTHILIDDANHFFKFLTRQSERVRLNESGILIPNGIMPTSGAGGDSAVFRRASDGQFYIKPAGGGGTNNVNVGSGFRIYQPSTEGIKTLFNGYAVKIDSSSNTDGLTFKADSALLTTTASRQKLIDSLNAEGWGSTYNVNDQNNYQYYYDISGSTQANMYGYVPVGTGSSTTRTSAPPADNWLGGIELNVGTTTTGFCYTHFGNSGVIAGIAINNSYRYNFGMKLRLEDLSDGTDTYHVIAGFTDHNNDDASTVDGVWFSYTHSASSGQWVCNTRSNSTSTTTASGITVAADTDYELEITVFNGNAYFYINKSLVATTSTNIPTGTARATSIANAIRKSAGTTNRKMYVEWLGYGKRSN